MNQGVMTIIYPVTDLEQAKAQFTALLGVQPAVDSAYYVGYRVGNQDIGLDPQWHRAGVTAYYHVGDIQASLKQLTDGGAEVVAPVNDVGGGRLIASVRDANGNLIGLIQDTAPQA